MAALDARIVLSLDTFNPETDRALLGANTVAAKLEVLDLLEKHNVTVTILPAEFVKVFPTRVGSREMPFPVLSAIRDREAAIGPPVSGVHLRCK